MTASALHVHPLPFGLLVWVETGAQPFPARSYGTGPLLTAVD